MLALPGKDDKNARSMLEKEIERQLQIMEENDVNSPEYKFAFENYKELHERKLAEDKLVESKHTRWFDAICTGLLAGITLTAEYWTPITSKWGSTIMRPFKHNNKL